MKRIIILVLALSCTLNLVAQSINASPEYIKALTARWQGERFEDGRPKIPDSILERLKNVTIEECWAELMKLGYQNQFEGDWTLLNDDPDAVTTGRAVTAQFMPMRPDLEEAIIEQGKNNELLDKNGFYAQLWHAGI